MFLRIHSTTPPSSFINPASGNFGSRYRMNFSSLGGGGAGSRSAALFALLLLATLSGKGKKKRGGLPALIDGIENGGSSDGGAVAVDCWTQGGCVYVHAELVECEGPTTGEHHADGGSTLCFLLSSSAMVKPPKLSL